MKKIHRAWFVLAGCTLMFFTVCGLAGNGYATFSPFIMTQNGYSKTQVSLIGSASSLSATLAIMCTTRYYKRISLRNGMLLAGLLCAAGFVILGFAGSYPVYILGSAIKGFAYGLGSMVPISRILEKWFHSKLTLCLSIVSASSGLATIGIPSLNTWIIQTFGLRAAFCLNAAAFAVLFFIAWLLVRDDPARLSLTAYEDASEKKKKLTADGSNAAAADTKVPAPAEDAVSSAVAVRYLPDRWWTLLSAAVLLATCAVTCYGSLSLLSTTEGYAPETVAIVISAAGASLMTGKLLFGTVSTAIGLKKTSVLFGSLSVVGLLLCCLTPLSGVFLFTGTVLLGLSLSTLTIGSVAWVQDWAAPEDRADHVRSFQSMYNLGCLVNGILVGIVADACGGRYIPFYAIAAGISLLFVLTVYGAYKKQG